MTFERCCLRSAESPLTVIAVATEQVTEMRLNLNTLLQSLLPRKEFSIQPLKLPLVQGRLSPEQKSRICWGHRRA